MTRPARIRVGSANTLASRGALYSLRDGLELERQEMTDIVRTRVFYDDVVTVTYHRALPLAESLVLGAITGVVLFVAALFLANESLFGALVTLLLALLPGIPLALLLVFRHDVVTVFGRRTKVHAHFLLRKRRARELFDDVCSRVRRAHREMEAAAAASVPPPPPLDEDVPAPPP